MIAGKTGIMRRRIFSASSRTIFSHRAKRCCGSPVRLSPSRIVRGGNSCNTAPGGPKEVEKLYTRPMLEEEFSGLHDVQIVEQELELNEGASHAGLSAVIGMTAWK